VSFGELAGGSPFWQTFPVKKTRKQEFSIIVERDEEGYYVASVPTLPGCHTQARSLDKLTERIREAIELVLEVDGANAKRFEFIGVQRIAV
jgi:predicted RNase H-like HicB family nuclease